MRIRDIAVEPPVALAPMSGVTDSSFRRLCREAGAGLTYTGLISANALRYASEKSLQLLSFGRDQPPVCAQVFGADPDIVAAAAEIAVARGADVVDINMGCSVPKVLKARAGAALMAEPERAEAIVRRAVRAAGATPVTVKLRRGYPDRGEQAPALSRRLEQAGAAAISVHPRWAREGFRAEADWSVIAQVRRSVAIPVIGNGDIRGPADALRMVRETRCDAVMIGRAALGNPWIFSQLAALRRGSALPPPSAEERIAMAARHLALVVADRGEARAAREMRKHFAWYLKGMANAAALRDQANRARTRDELLAVLETAREAVAAAETLLGGRH